MRYLRREETLADMPVSLRRSKCCAWMLHASSSPRRYLIVPNPSQPRSLALVTGQKEQPPAGPDASKRPETRWRRRWCCATRSRREG